MAKTQIKGENVFDKSLKAIDIDISGATEKTTLVDNDSIVINDSADNLTKRSKLSTLLAYFNAIFQRKLILQELSSLTDVIPTGFKGLFAKGSGLFFKNSTGTEEQLLTSATKTVYKDNDVVMNTNSFGGRKLYLNSLDNAMYAANKKWWVLATTHLKSYNGETYPKINPDWVSIYEAIGSGAIYNVTNSPVDIIVYNGNTMCNPAATPTTEFQYTYVNGVLTFGASLTDILYVYPGSTLTQYLDSPVASSNANPPVFDCWYEGGWTIPIGYYGKIRVMFNDTGTLWYPGVYPYGFYYLSYYYTNTPESAYVRTFNRNYRLHGVRWTILQATDYINTNASQNFVQVCSQGTKAGVTIIEFIINSQDTIATNVNEIEWKLDRPYLSVSGSTVTKFGVNKLYYALEFWEQLTKKIGLNPDGSATFEKTVQSNEIINFDANIEPTQTGVSVTKTSTWMWQYLAQGIKWLRANMLALGETSATAYRGDRGKIAYDHSQVAHAPSTAEQNVNADWNAVSGDAQILNKPTIPAAQVQTDWNAATGMGVLLNKPASLPANGGNADTLDTLHASAFAKFNTAFTTWDNIASNTPPVHVHVLDATGVLYNKDLFMYLDVNNSDTAPKVFVLQPGTYSINDIIDCSTHNLVGIIGLSKHDTIIEIECNEALTNLKFLENVTLKITAAFTGTFLVSAADSAGSYVKSVSVACDDIVNDCFDVFAFQGFNSVENVDIRDVSGACNECKNISGVMVVNSTVTTATDVLTLFYSCVNLSNINITHNDFNKMFSKCDNVSNVVVNLASNENSQAIYSCTNVSNCNITGAFVAVASCTVVTNVIISTATTGILESAIITNCKTDSCTEYGFADSEKLSNCLASNTVLTGFDRCRGMVNNKADSNTTNYNSCNADLGSLYAVSDTPNGGFNT